MGCLLFWGSGAVVLGAIAWAMYGEYRRRKENAERLAEIDARVRENQRKFWEEQRKKEQAAMQAPKRPAPTPSAPKKREYDDEVTSSKPAPAPILIDLSDYRQQDAGPAVEHHSFHGNGGSFGGGGASSSWDSSSSSSHDGSSSCSFDAGSSSSDGGSCGGSSD